MRSSLNVGAASHSRRHYGYPMAAATTTSKKSSVIISRPIFLLSIVIIFILWCLLSEMRPQHLPSMIMESTDLSLSLLSSSSSSSAAASHRKDRRSDMAVVMMDTRDLFDFSPEDPKKLWYGQAAALMNQRYACKHGYDFLFFHTTHKESEVDRSEVPRSEDGGDELTIGCRSKYGLRSATWCKIIGISRALDMGYSTIAFIDTDAFFSGDRSMTIPEMIRNYTDTEVLEKEGQTVLVSGDFPFRSNRMNTGFMIIQNGVKTKEFLKIWWDTDAGVWDVMSPYEQEVMNQKYEEGWTNYTSAIYHMKLDPVAGRERNEIEHFWKVPLEPYPLPVTHITHYDKETRSPAMLISLGMHEILDTLQSKVVEDVSEEEGSSIFNVDRPQCIIRRYTVDGTSAPIEL